MSVVTPSLNQGRFLREALLSVWGQDYPNLEHIVIDGGSSDGTLDLLREFESLYPLRWRSETDRGQSHALNKGFGSARGHILGWLNADDTYLPGAIASAVEAFTADPRIEWVHGLGYAIDEHGWVIRELKPGRIRLKDLTLGGMLLVQPTLFFLRSAFERTTGFDEDIHTTMDEAFCLQLAVRSEGAYIERHLATRRAHRESKSSKNSLRFCEDSLLAAERFFSLPDIPDSIRKARRQAISNRHGICARRSFSEGLFEETKRHVLKAFKEYRNPMRKEFLVLLVLLVQSVLQVKWIEPGLKRRRAIAQGAKSKRRIRLCWIGDDKPEFSSQSIPGPTSAATGEVLSP